MLMKNKVNAKQQIPFLGTRYSITYINAKNVIGTKGNDKRSYRPLIKRWNNDNILYINRKSYAVIKSHLHSDLRYRRRYSI